MGYLGASPFHSAFINLVGAAVGAGAAYVWTKGLGHATTCDAAAPRRVAARTAVEHERAVEDSV